MLNRMIAIAVFFIIVCGAYPAWAAQVPAAASLQENDASGDAVYEEYAGYLFSGKDPWDGTLTIMIGSIVDGKMEWTFTDSFEDHTLFQMQKDTVLQNGKADFTLQGSDVEHEEVSFSYQGQIELKDGKVTVVFLSGSVTEKSPEGGSSYHAAEALSDSGISNAAVLDKAEQGPYVSYTVQEGDSVHSIAQEYGISTKDLVILNQVVILETAKSHGLEYDDVTEYAKHLYPGEKLLVPGE